MLLFCFMFLIILPQMRPQNNNNSNSLRLCFVLFYVFVSWSTHNRHNVQALESVMHCSGNMSLLFKPNSSSYQGDEIVKEFYLLLYSITVRTHSLSHSSCTRFLCQVTHCCVLLKKNSLCKTYSTQQLLLHHDY